MCTYLVECGEDEGNKAKSNGLAKLDLFLHVLPPAIRLDEKKRLNALSELTTILFLLLKPQ